MTEAQVFQCPSCGGPLSLSEDSPSIRCEYCSNTIVVPAALRKDSGVVPKEMRRVESFLSAQDAGNVRLLVANGKKIEAIRLLRSLTDLSLKDAKEIADAIERGDPVGPIHNRSSYNESALTEERWAQILTSIQQGRTIEAIRLVREIADVSLHDAKILVETIHSNPGGIDISYHNASFLLEAISRGESQEYTQQRLQAIQVTQAYEQVPTNQPAQVTFTKANPKILGRTSAALGTGLSCSIIGSIIFSLAVVALPLFFIFASNNGPLAAIWSKINPQSFASVEMTLKGEGIAPGLFNDPRAVSVDKNGNIYVADYSSGRLQSLDGDGVSRWLVNLGEHTIIKSLDVSPDGLLWITAKGKIRRFKLDDGQEETSFTDPENDYYFEDLNFAPDGRLAVIVDGEDLLVYNPDLSLHFQVPEAVSSVTQDSELDCDVAIDALGNIYVLGHFNEKVLKYSPDGRYVNQFGGETSDPTPGKFRAVGDIAVDPEGRVFVSDSSGIQVFNGDGQYLDQFKLFQYVHGMDFDNQNNLYVTSNESEIIQLKIRK